MKTHKMRDKSLTATGSRILKATLREKRTLFLVPDQKDFEQLLDDLQTIARALSSPRISFDGETHKIVHNKGCDDEISIWTYTIYGVVLREPELPE